MTVAEREWSARSTTEGAPDSLFPALRSDPIETSLNSFLVSEH